MGMKRESYICLILERDETCVGMQTSRFLACYLAMVLAIRGLAYSPWVLASYGFFRKMWFECPKAGIRLRAELGGRGSSKEKEYRT
jgi:hypothetical protein